MVRIKLKNEIIERIIEDEPAINYSNNFVNTPLRLRFYYLQMP